MLVYKITSLFIIGGSSNLGSAVATSMNLANSTEPMVDPSCAHYKIDTPHDMLYYPVSGNSIVFILTSYICYYKLL